MIKVWTILAILAAILLAYGYMIRRLRHLARNRKSVNQSDACGELPESDYTERYARHIVLREIGGPGQDRIARSGILVIGAGGIGSPALLYAAAAGFGRIGIADDDIVELSNLQRQIIHSEHTLGEAKTVSAKNHIIRLNSRIEAVEHKVRLDADNAADIIRDYNIVIDGSDRMETRRIVNRACLQTSVPLVFAAISQWEGQLGVIMPGEGPCYECLFPSDPLPGQVPSCAEAGVVGALPGVMGSIAVIEAVKVIVGAGETLNGKVLVHDALYGNSRYITHVKNPDCPVCGG